MHRIVVIEDNAADVLLLRIALDQHAKHRYELEVLKDGEDALRFVREHRSGQRPAEPCVVVLDLHLPKYDGLTVLGALKQTPDLAHVHVAVLTTSASPTEEARIREYGVRLYRTKPLILEEFLELGGEILSICEEQQVLHAGV